MTGQPPDVRPASVRTNAPQRAPRFPDTAWGRLRGERGWSLRELAERSGISAAELSRIERGFGPRPEHARKLLVVYGSRTDQLGNLLDGLTFDLVERRRELAADAATTAVIRIDELTDAIAELRAELRL